VRAIGLYVAQATLAASRRSFGFEPLKPIEPRGNRRRARLGALWEAPELEPFIPQLRNYPR
jgi:hypothetical protein